MSKVERLPRETADVTNENIDKIAALFPNCLTEAKDEHGRVVKAIDFDKLRQELSHDIVEGPQERYQFNWPEKRKAMLLANTPTSMTLRPCREESVNFDTTQNLYIEGDNLEVLKLLRENYLGRVKMIYIDPPYNTGNDSFVYDDDFSKSAEEFADESGATDEEGNRNFDLRQNNESNGRFHTDWLNMLYPRLKVAKDLLDKDGVAFISIDENEVTNLRRICDEIFGEKNFVDALHWKRKKQPSFLAKHTAKVMEYVIVYAKCKECLEKLSLEKLSDATKKVINVSNVECTRHFSSGVRVKIGNTGVIKKGRYTIKTMTVEYLTDVRYENGRTIDEVDVIARFSVSQDKITEYINSDLLFITANSGLRRDVSLEESQKAKAITDLLLSDYGDNQESEIDMVDIFGGKYFDYTKPVKLIYNLIKCINTDDRLVMDFFSGSATTAHAVMKLNAEDESIPCRFILVQLPERLEDTLERTKAPEAKEKIRQAIMFLDGLHVPHNLCEIGKERIRRAGKKIMEEWNASRGGAETRSKMQGELGLGGAEATSTSLSLRDSATPRETPPDIGFRVLKLDSSNMEDVLMSPAKFAKEAVQGTLDFGFGQPSSQMTMDFERKPALASNIKPGRTAEDLLFQAMLRLDIPLSAKIETEEIHGKKVFSVMSGHLLATFDKDVNEETIATIAKRKPGVFVMCDGGFATDNVADNFEQIWCEYSPDTVRRVI